MSQNITDDASEVLDYQTLPDFKSNQHLLNKKSLDFDFALPYGNITNKLAMGEDAPKYTHTTKLEQENYMITADHCYARPWNWRPEMSFFRPAKILFVNKPLLGIRKTSNPLVSLQSTNEFIDVESEAEIPNVQYDIEKAKFMMDECQRYALSAKPDGNDEDWEEKISKTNWTSTQNRIFNNMVHILNNFQLAKLACISVRNEPILRHTIIRKSVQRIRKLMATVAWDQKLTQWLHQLLIDHLDPLYLTCYLDILQALKSKLPAFVEKMMHGPNSSSRLGPLNNANLSQVLDKSWSSIFSTIIQDKPKKLPGNPIIVVCPTAPVVPKIINKWIKLLSNIGTVVTVTANFGQCLSSFNPKCSTGHRMTLPNCVDHLFSLTRGKIQDIRVEFPGRNIILVGFNAGATLALQVAQVESVLCVVSLGFSLLTAEGRRGEPEDNLLELQCPVLFVIGQRSNTSFQEDMEDLRERMRVETGLVVVGSADDYLRVSNKKINMEGITQAVVDRCIIDEVGDFISGLILSPYPPQIRQPSTNIVLSESSAKKTKFERTRYNSNTSSVDSGPPSPTPRTTRPVGRPPGSKSKSRLEAKWAQQIAQARMQAYGLNRSLNPAGTLSTLLQGGIKTIPPSQPKSSVSGIKVLENVTLNSSTTAKLIQNKAMHLPKVALVNAAKRGNTNIGNVFLLPDGTLKTIQGTSVKGTGGTPIILPLSSQKSPAKPFSRNKYITTKRQLIGQKPPRTVRTPIYMPSVSMQTPLPPPPSLTSQDIMNLPIIFADDNKILEPNISTQGSKNNTQVATTSSSMSTGVSNTTSKVLQTITPGKYMLVNKQPTSQGNFIITPTNFKKQNSITFNKPPPKYTKIILSSKKHNLEELKSASKIQTLTPEITLRKVQPSQTTPELIMKQSSPAVELIDLENEIKATAVPKPNVNIDKNMVNSKDSNKEILIGKPNTSLLVKRPLSITEFADDGDPDYVPPKNLKLQ